MVIPIDPPIRLQKTDRICVLKSPVTAYDVGRAWVIHLHLADIGEDLVLKIYPDSGRDYCQHEREIAELIQHSRVAVTLPEPRPLPLRPIKGVAVAFRFVPGEPLTYFRSRRNWRPFFAKVIGGLIQTLSQIETPRAVASDLVYSDNLGVHFWKADFNSVPSITWEDHTKELRADIRRIAAIPFDWKLLESSCLARFERFGPIGDTIRGFVHHDLNSDNILVCPSQNAVIDIGLCIHSSLFVEWGGAIAHLGRSTRPFFRRQAQNIGCCLQKGEIDHLLDLYTIKRAVRRLAYLDQLSRRTGFDAAYVRKHVRRQLITMQKSASIGLH